MQVKYLVCNINPAHKEIVCFDLTNNNQVESLKKLAENINMNFNELMDEVLIIRKKQQNSK